MRKDIDLNGEVHEKEAYAREAYDKEAYDKEAYDNVLDNNSIGGQLDALEQINNNPTATCVKLSPFLTTWKLIKAL